MIYGTKKNTKFLSAGSSATRFPKQSPPLQISGHAPDSNQVFANFHATRVLPDATFQKH